MHLIHRKGIEIGTANADKYEGSLKKWFVDYETRTIIVKGTQHKFSFGKTQRFDANL